MSTSPGRCLKEEIFQALKKENYELTCEVMSTGTALAVRNGDVRNLKQQVKDLNETITRLTEKDAENQELLQEFSENERKMRLEIINLQKDLEEAEKNDLTHKIREMNLKKEEMKQEIRNFLGDSNLSEQNLQKEEQLKIYEKNLRMKHLNMKVDQKKELDKQQLEHQKEMKWVRKLYEKELRENRDKMEKMKEELGRMRWKYEEEKKKTVGDSTFQHALDNKNAEIRHLKLHLENKNQKLELSDRRHQDFLKDSEQKFAAMSQNMQSGEEKIFQLRSKIENLNRKIFSPRCEFTEPTFLLVKQKTALKAPQPSSSEGEEEWDRLDDQPSQ